MTGKRLHDRLIKRKTIESKNKIITTEWFSNPNYTNDVDALRNGEKEIGNERETYNRRFVMYILIAIIVILLNLYAVTWEFYVQYIFGYATVFQSLVMVALAKFWKIPDHIAAEITLIIERFTDSG